MPQKSIKVIFIFPYPSHYYNYVLNRLNDIAGIEVVMLIPSNLDDMASGGGINQTQANAKFRFARLPAKNFGPIASFQGLAGFLWREKPDIVVGLESNIANFFFHLPVLLVTKLRGIKVVLKSIPLQVPKFRDAFRRQTEGSQFVERLPRPLRFLMEHCGGETFLRGLRACFNGLLFRGVDAHLNYVEEAVPVFGSYGVSSERIFITYNSPDTDTFRVAEEKIRPENIQRKLNQIVHVGRLVSWKRVDLLIRATASLVSRFPDVKLLVVGVGPQMDELKKLAQDLGVADRVEFRGGVYDIADLGKILESSHVYVLAGMGGLSINDAMFFHRPIICSVCDGTEKKLVREGENGFYFKSGDLDSLTEKLALMFSDPARAEKMGLRSREIVEKEVNVQTVLNGYIRCFNYLARTEIPLQVNPWTGNP